MNFLEKSQKNKKTKKLFPLWLIILLDAVAVGMDGQRVQLEDLPGHADGFLDAGQRVELVAAIDDVEQFAVFG